MCSSCLVGDSGLQCSSKDRALPPPEDNLQRKHQHRAAVGEGYLSSPSNPSRNGMFAPPLDASAYLNLYWKVLWQAGSHVSAAALPQP